MLLRKLNGITLIGLLLTDSKVKPVLSQSNIDFRYGPNISQKAISTNISNYIRLHLKSLV